MKKTKIIYWILTGLICAFMLLSSIPNIISSADSVKLFEQIHYPAYLLPFLGTAKLLGVIALLVPRFPRLKEWAYAGLFFDLAGATYSFIAIGIPFSGWSPMLIGFILLFGSYIYYHKTQAA